MHGKKYTDEWADELVHSLYGVSHRHMVFTIPEELRVVLGADHGLFKAMMDAVSQTLRQLVKPRRGGCSRRDLCVASVWEGFEA